MGKNQTRMICLCVLVLGGMELFFFIVVCMVLRFGFVNKTALITHPLVRKREDIFIYDCTLMYLYAA